MQTRSALRAAIAAAALANLVAPALALTQASLQLSGFTTSLKDLNAGDGIAPSMAWIGAAQVSAFSQDFQQSGWTQNGLWLQANWVNAGGFNVADATQLDAATAQGQAHAQAQGDAFSVLLLGSTSLAGSKNNTAVSFTRSFTLSAGSQVDFRYMLTGAYSGASADGLWSQAGGPLDLHSMTGFGTTMTVGLQNAGANASGANDWGGETDAYESVVDGREVVLTLRNTGAMEKTYLLSVGAYVNTSELMAPVPEPSSYALMALGLIAVGGIAGKRRRG